MQNPWRQVRYVAVLASLLEVIFIVFQPLTAHAEQKQSVTQINYYVCGDQAAFISSNWHNVLPGAMVHDKQYNGPANGYNGVSGDPHNSPGNCNGDYQWAWNQTWAQAIWTWNNANLPANTTCKVGVHIPSWYAGAPDARYKITMTSANAGLAYPFDPQNQNQEETTWVDLTIGGHVAEVLVPRGGTYNVKLELTNGGTPGWYLGADAVRFECTAPNFINV